MPTIRRPHHGTTRAELCAKSFAFKHACLLANITPTRHQAKQFRRNRGLAWAALQAFHQQPKQSGKDDTARRWTYMMYRLVVTDANKMRYGFAFQAEEQLGTITEKVRSRLRGNPVDTVEVYVKDKPEDPFTLDAALTAQTTTYFKEGEREGSTVAKQGPICQASSEPPTQEKG